jgi:Na+/serine symporter
MYMNTTKANFRIVRRERALSMFFTQNQVAIIKKIINMERLTALENATYSRRIKPRLNAVIDLYDMAITARSKD